RTPTRRRERRRGQREFVSYPEIEHRADVDGEQETLEISELWVVTRQLVEVVVGGVDVAGLVAGLAEQVVRVADLARLAGVLQSLLAGLTRLLVLLEIEVSVAKVDVRIGEAARDFDRVDDVLDHVDAFASL